MLPEIHRALQRLLYDHGHIPAYEVDVRFEAPTKEWAETLTRPTINLFLCHVRENTELRSANLQTTRSNGIGQRKLPPRRIDLHYLVSAITTELDDEHRLLWRAMAALMKYPHLPPETLPEELRALDPPLLAQVKQPKDGPRPLDVWTALGAAPRPALEYVVTAPLDLDVTIAAPLVLTRTVRYGSLRDEITPDAHRRIGGIVRDGDGRPAAGVDVALEGRAVEGSVTNADGWFTLYSVPAGRVTLRATPPGGAPTTRTVEVPADSYDITLESAPRRR